jgi:hypothetical protein
VTFCSKKKGELSFYFTEMDKQPRSSRKRIAKESEKIDQEDGPATKKTRRRTTRKKSNIYEIKGYSWVNENDPGEDMSKVAIYGRCELAEYKGKAIWKGYKGKAWQLYVRRG